MQKHYDKSANGLRGLAALSAASLHFLCAFSPSLLAKNLPNLFGEEPEPGFLFSVFQFPLFNLVYNGEFAIFIFFVLSGYVLTIPYFKDQLEPLKLRFLGRYLRLNTAVFVSVSASYALYSFDLYNHVAAGQRSGSGWLADFFPRNIDMPSAAAAAVYKALFFGEATLNPPLWTFKIEFIGSLLLLGLYMCTPRQRVFPVTLLTMVLLHWFFGTQSLYFIALFLGALLNETKMSARAVRCCFIAGVYFGAFQYHSPFYDFLPSFHYGDIEPWNRRNAYNLLGACLLIASVINGFGRTFLEKEIVQFLGKISFSLYVFHFLILCSLSSTFFLIFPPSFFFITINFCLYLAICFTIAALATRFIDRPAIDLSRRFAEWLLRRFKTNAP